MSYPGSLVIIQARDTSERLPGKVASVKLHESYTALEILLDRLTVNPILNYLGTTFIVAAPDEEASITIAEIAADFGIAYHEGPIDDVLMRRWQAASKFPDAEWIAIAGADDCLQDGDSIGVALITAMFNPHPAPYYQTLGWTLGGNGQVVHRNALMQANASAMLRDEREHYTLFWDRRPDRYRRVVLERHVNRDDLRLTLDTADDLALFRKIIGNLGTLAPLDEIIAWLDAHPQDQVKLPHYVPEGTPIRDGTPLIIVGHDPAKGDL